MADNELTQPNRNSRFRDAHTDKRIHEHLSNKEDQISEDDIRSVQIDVAPVTTDTGSEPLPDEATRSDEEVVGDEQVKDNEDPQTTTPYNILAP